MVRNMSTQPPKPSLSDNMKRALEAKKAAAGQGLGLSRGVDAKSLEQRLQREAAALNKPAYKRMSHRG